MKVSPACDGCYAEQLMGMNGRFRRVHWGEKGNGIGTRERTSPSTWRNPRRWNREAAADKLLPPGERRWPRGRFVFCASLADVFDKDVLVAWRRDLFDLIRATPHLTWLLLTKRPQNIVRLFRDACGKDADWPPNAAILCTVVTQEEANRDVPVLLEAKRILRPAFAGISVEPMLGPMDLTAVKRTRETLDWVICGGETDQGQHKSRPQNPAWFRSLRDQCAATGVAFHHKQNGEWCEYGEHGRLADGTMNFLGKPDDAPDRWAIYGETVVTKVGKARAGRLLDGMVHDARPVVAL
jgi:protein gp37